MPKNSVTKESRIYNRKKTASSTNNVAKTGQLHAKELDHFHIPYAKLNSKWIKYYNVKT